MRFNVELIKLPDIGKRSKDILEAINSSLYLLIISVLDRYIERAATADLVELYTKRPDSIAKLGYSSIGDLVIKNLKFNDIRENKYLYLFTMELDFDLSKLPKADALEVMKMFQNIFYILDSGGKTEKIVA